MPIQFAPSRPLLRSVANLPRFIFRMLLVDCEQLSSALLIDQPNAIVKPAVKTNAAPKLRLIVSLFLERTNAPALINWQKRSAFVRSFTDVETVR